METLQKVLHPQSLLQSERVVVVSGADKGIGFAVVKGILKENPNWTVYLTSRDISRGEAAVQRCYNDISLTPKYHQLDIDDISSIRRFRDHIRENHKNGIHILINNAGIYPDVRSHESSSSRTGESSTVESSRRTEESERGHVEKEVREAGKETGGKRLEEQRSETTMKEEGKESRKEEVKFRFNRENFKAIVQNNYFSTLQVCQELFPLLGDNSSVVFVGSRMANLAFMSTKEDKQLLLRGCSRIEDCSKLMEQLMNCDPEKLYNPEDKDDKEAWLAKSPDTELVPNYQLGAIYPWAMSKLGLAIICRLYQLQFDSEKMNQNVHIVTCCPGLVKTDLNPLGVRTPEQGADTIVWAALQPKDTQIRGVVCGDRKMLDPFVLPEGSTIF
jgi:NAD(P)-dependent dehydrogenase (short-subunit alcohol dehydrogenase family)